MVAQYVRQNVKRVTELTAEQIEAVPLSVAGEFQFGNEKELKAARRVIYALNKVGRMRFRTQKDLDNLLMVWRVV